MAVTSWAGANGFSRSRCNLSRHNSISFLPALLGDAD
jgi:hypothetical protein